MSTAPNRRSVAERDHTPRRRYVSIVEAADYLGVSERTIRTMIADGRLTGYRMAKNFIRLDLDEIDAAMTPYGGGVSV